MNNYKTSYTRPTYTFVSGADLDEGAHFGKKKHSLLYSSKLHGGWGGWDGA